MTSQHAHEVTCAALYGSAELIMRKDRVFAVEGTVCSISFLVYILDYNAGSGGCAPKI